MITYAISFIFYDYIRNCDSFANSSAVDNAISSRVASLRTNCLCPGMYAGKPDTITGSPVFTPRFEL